MIHNLIIMIYYFRPIQQGYIWFSSSTGIPANAVESGYDVDGSPIYVGRAAHESDLLPANVFPSKQVAYVSYNGEEIQKHQFEVTETDNALFQGTAHEFTIDFFVRFYPEVDLVGLHLVMVTFHQMLWSVDSPAPANISILAVRTSPTHLPLEKFIARKADCTYYLAGRRFSSRATKFWLKSK